MINHYLGAALVRERHGILLPGLRARSAPAGTQIVLRDGSHVLIRQVQSADAPLLAEGSELLARLSDRARQEGIRRFTALVAAENVAVAGLLRNACASLVRRDSSTREYEIALVPGEEQDRPAGLERLSLPAGYR